MTIPENRFAIALLMLLGACSHGDSKGDDPGVTHELKGTGPRRLRG